MKSSKSILMLLLILSLNVLLNSSCKKYKQEEHYNQVIEFNDFPKEINIKGHQTGPKKFFLEPMKIGKLDSILYILDYKKKNKLFLYNLNNKKIISEAAPSGIGPMELVGATQYCFENSGKFIYILDGQSYRIFKYNIDSLITKNKYRQEYKNQIDQVEDTTFFLRDFKYLNDSLMVLSGIGNSYGILLYNNNKDAVMNCLNPRSNKVHEDLLQKKIKGFDYYALMNYGIAEGEGDKIVTFGYTSNEIQIIDSQSPYNKTLIMHSNKIYPDLEKQGNGRIPCGNPQYSDIACYVDGYVTKDYIYLLYSGEKFKSPTHFLGNKIHVFNKKGKQICKFNLNFNLRGIVVDEKENKIFGIAYYKNQPIIIFELNKKVI